ncbi:HNH endonuclease [bacterium]|nr:HNH endonuclease [bacterium]
MHTAPDLHRKLLSAIAELGRIEKQAVLLFAEISERRLFRDLGFSSMRQYSRSALGFSDAKFYQFQRLAESFKALPKVKMAVASGELTWTKARTVASVAKPESQQEWIEVAKSSNSRKLEQQVKAARRGDVRAPAPDLFSEEGSEPAARRLVNVNLKLEAEQLAQLESLEEALRKQGLKGSREEVLLAALDLAASGDCTRVQSSPKQVVIYQCEDCGDKRVNTSRGLIETNAPTDDAKVLGRDGVNRSSIPPKTRNQVLARDGHQCKSTGCGNTRFLEVHHKKPRSEGGSHETSNLITLCSACHGLVHRGTTMALRE